MRSTARPIWTMRSLRHAQIDGLMKCTTRMPRARSFSSRARLKSGASTQRRQRAAAPAGAASVCCAASAGGASAAILRHNLAPTAPARAPSIKTSRDHAVATDAGAADIRQSTTQFSNYASGEQIARSLPGHEGAGARRLHQRMMPRCELPTKSFSRPIAPADAGCSATIAARPRRPRQWSCLPCRASCRRAAAG